MANHSQARWDITFRLSSPFFSFSSLNDRASRLNPETLGRATGSQTTPLGSTPTRWFTPFFLSFLTASIFRRIRSPHFTFVLSSPWLFWARNQSIGERIRHRHYLHVDGHGCRATLASPSFLALHNRREHGNLNEAESAQGIEGMLKATRG